MAQVCWAMGSTGWWLERDAVGSAEAGSARQEETGRGEQPVPDTQERSCVLHNRIIGNICRHWEI